MKKVGEIAKWLESTAKEMYEKDECGMAHIFLDEYRDCCLAVGWIGGYDENERFAYHSKSQPTYCLNAGIVKYNPSDCCNMEFCDMPYDPASGEVYDTECTLGVGTNYGQSAAWYIKEYRNIMKEIEKGTLK